MLRWQRPGNWDLTCLQTLPCSTNDIEQHCPPQAGVWIMFCLGKRRHFHPAELTPSQGCVQEGGCTMSKAVLTPCLQPQGISRSPGMTSGLGGAGGCLSVHPLPPHELELATAPLGSLIPCSSKCWANGEVAARGTLCSAAAHSINLMRIFFFFFTRQMVK